MNIYIPPDWKTIEMSDFEEWLKSSEGPNYSRTSYANADVYAIIGGETFAFIIGKNKVLMNPKFLND